MITKKKKDAKNGRRGATAAAADAGGCGDGGRAGDYGGGGTLPANMPRARDVAEAVERRYGRSLSGVDLEIRLIPRGRYTDMQRGALKEYWNEVFSELGLQADWRDL